MIPICLPYAIKLATIVLECAGAPDAKIKIAKISIAAICYDDFIFICFITWNGRLLTNLASAIDIKPLPEVIKHPLTASPYAGFLLSTRHSVIS